MVGVLQSVQSDQGLNYMFSMFQEVMYKLGIKQVKSTVYHPQSQGTQERFHQTLKAYRHLTVYRKTRNRMKDFRYFCL